MRQKRAKNYRKQMRLYQMAFKFREPYQVLVDADFIADCVRQKIGVEKAIERTVQGQCKLMITQCCIRALYDRGNMAKQEIDIAKTFERRRCNHFDTPLSQRECIESVVNIKGQNKHRYVVASQDPKIRSDLRSSVPGVPIIYENRSVVILEPVSPLTERYQFLLEEKKLNAGLNHVHAGTLKQEAHEDSGNIIVNPDEDQQETSTRGGALKRKRGPRAPNPLSIKKKKPKIDAQRAEKEQKLKQQQQGLQDAGELASNEIIDRNQARNDNNPIEGQTSSELQQDGDNTSSSTKKKNRRRQQRPHNHGEDNDNNETSTEISSSTRLEIPA